MIVFQTGDILTSKANYLVNPTNFQGPMGGGLARAMSLRFPGMEKEYCRLCKSPKFAPKMRTFDYFAIWRDDGGQRHLALGMTGCQRPLPCQCRRLAPAQCGWCGDAGAEPQPQGEDGTTAPP